ncbi:putative glycoside hydrolase [Formosa sp. L2A11]|uniref:putative glycoside hydrolase n=1 Tax=Formosa sp. L2A11 TaxID=2686363 RepID=UPI0018EF3092|nr:putative glycoside hydrolase [Formosa sp. L2A11]
MKNKFQDLTYTCAIMLLLFTSVHLNAQTDAKTSYFNSDGSVYVSNPGYPKFNWNSTPMYYMFGDIERVLTPEEVSYIAARTDFICIEKSHGLKVYGASELGAKHEIAAFKKEKPEIKALFYFNSAYAWPFSSYSKNFTPEQINNHPDLKAFLLKDPETGALAYRDHYIQLVYFFDVLNPDFRKWWVDTVAKGVEESGADGAFIDQMHGFDYLREDKSAEVAKAQGELMAALKNKLGPDKIVLGNNAAEVEAVFPSADAFMFEHAGQEFTTKEVLLKEWDQMLKIAKAGKISIYRFGAKTTGTALAKADKKTKQAAMPKLSQDQVTFYQACYLIGAQPYAYFQYNWSWNLADGNLVNYPELSKPLGAPKGAYKRVTPVGWEFTREFEHASVWLDTENRKAKITWK